MVRVSASAVRATARPPGAGRRSTTTSATQNNFISLPSLNVECDDVPPARAFVNGLHFPIL